MGVTSERALPLDQAVGGYARSERALLQALELLDESRRHWLAATETYAGDRRAAKADGRRSPRTSDPNPFRHPTLPDMSGAAAPQRLLHRFVGSSGTHARSCPRRDSGRGPAALGRPVGPLGCVGDHIGDAQGGHGAEVAAVVAVSGRRPSTLLKFSGDPGQRGHLVVGEGAASVDACGCYGLYLRLERVGGAQSGQPLGGARAATRRGASARTNRSASIRRPWRARRLPDLGQPSPPVVG